MIDRDSLKTNPEAEGALSLYEGRKSYIFISYSHRDTACMAEVKNILEKNHVRFWYDNGLHSGDDWNLVIARHLENASVCLLLLSRNSAESEYVKNELNFAINHRVPIHALLLEEFVLPIDVEIMIGRFQMVAKADGYERKLLQALPSELYGDFSSGPSQNALPRANHPLFEIGVKLMDRQGTISYSGRHKTLGYEVLIQEESIVNANVSAVKEHAVLVSKLSHPLFPKIFDILIDDDRMWTYQEYRGEMFLDSYLQEHSISETKIMEWLSSVIGAMDYLFSLNLGFRDLARGSLVVLNQQTIGMFRLQNPYYGVFKLQPETKRYYFEKEVQEIAVLLYQLCTGEVPVLPFGMVCSDTISKSFRNVVNLIIQKSAREHGKIQYDSFGQIKEDLYAHRIKIRDSVFLKQRRAKLDQYEKIKTTNMYRFTDGEGSNSIRKDNLEEEFGLEATVLLSEQHDLGTPAIRVLICDTGQLLEFSKTQIMIGRSSECDMILNQPSVSRRHAIIYKNTDGNYMVSDLNTSNGISLMSGRGKLLSGQQVQVPKDEIIEIGRVKLKLL